MCACVIGMTSRYCNTRYFYTNDFHSGLRVTSKPVLSHADLQIKSNNVFKVMRVYKLYIKSTILLKYDMKTNILFLKI